jgi:hypothetical protein
MPVAFDMSFVKMVVMKDLMILYLGVKESKPNVILVGTPHVQGVGLTP